MRALVTGATGLIGRQLQSRLDEVAVPSRDTERAKRGLAAVDDACWSFESGPPPRRAAGRPGGSAAAEAAACSARATGSPSWPVRAAGRECSSPPSAVGYHGDRGAEDLEEASSAGGGGFLAGVSLLLCERSETLTSSQRARPGVVLGTDHTFRHGELGVALDALLAAGAGGDGS